MKESKIRRDFLQYHRGLQKAGFAAVCVMSAVILAVCLYKRFYTANVSDVFNLSMDILGTVVCSMLYYGCLTAGGAKKRNIHSYICVLFVNVLVFLFDSLMWMLDGSADLRVLNTVVSMCFYASVNLLVYLFWRHAVTILKPGEKMLRILDLLQRILLIPALLMCVINLFTPFLFQVDADGVFHRAFGYPAGSFYILITFALLIVIAVGSRIGKWRKIFVILPAVASILAFLLLGNNPELAISYTVCVIAMIITNCILFGERPRMKELIIRIFSVLLLCMMLIYGPVIYRIGIHNAIREGYQSVKEAFLLAEHVLDETGLEELCDPGNMELYQETRQKFRWICNALSLQNLYVETIDEKEMTRSFVIVVAASDEEDAIVRESLGWPGASIWTEESHLNEPELIVMTGGYTDLYSEEDNEYGHNLDWFYPYKDANGNVRAILGADVDVGTKQTEAVMKSLKAIAPAIILFFITLLVLIHVIDFVFIRPFYGISRHMQHFFTAGKKNKEEVSLRSSYEIWFLSRSFTFMSAELDEYEEIRTREIKEKQRVSTEVELAKAIQAQFLPSVFPPYPDRTEFEIYASMDPAKEVAGDFYDFFFVDPDHLAIVIADVSGKGFPAALFMMRSKTVIRSVAEQGLPPAEILERANLTLREGNEKRMFVTVWIGIIDLKTGIMKCANGGHEHPFLRKGQGNYKLLRDRHCPVVGVKKQLDAEEYELRFEPGDSLFVYTDGIPDTENAEEEFFSLDRLKRSLIEHGGDSMEELLRDVSGDLHTFMGEADQFDDITMLGFRYLGKS